MPFIPDAEQTGFRPDRKTADQLRAEVASAEKDAGRSVLSRFASALPGAAANQLLRQPARFVASAAIAPVDIARQTAGLAQGRSVEPFSGKIPFVGQTFQGQAAQEQKQIASGDRSLISGLKPFAEVPLAAAETVGLAKLAGAAGKGVTGVFEKRATERARKFALDLTAPKATPAVAEAALKEGRTTAPGIFKAAKIVPNSRDHLIAESVQDVVKPRAGIDANIDAINTKISQINNGVKNMILDRKVPFNTAQLRSQLNSGNEDLRLIFASDKTAERTYRAVVDEFMKHVGKKDTAGLFQARQEFDRIPAIKKLLQTEGMGENTRKEIVLAVRRAANEYIASLLPANNPYRRLLGTESRMLEAIGNIAEKGVKTIGKNKIQLLTDKYPLLKWVVSGLAGAGGIGVGNVIINSLD